MSAVAASSPGRDYALGVVFITVSMLAWSTAGFFQRLIALDAWTLMFWRGVFGALTGLAWVAVQERGAVWRGFRGFGPAALAFSLASSVGMISFLWSLSLTTVAHVTIIYATLPFVAAVLAAVVLNERLTASTLGASLLALMGVAITVTGGWGEGDWRGDACAFAMVLTMAVMIGISRHHRAIPMVPAASLSAMLTMAVSSSFVPSFSVDGPTLGLLALFGSTNLGLGLVLFTLGAPRIPAVQTALIGALDTLTAPLWVWLAFDEAPRPITLAGGAVVMIAVVGHVLLERRRTA